MKVLGGGFIVLFVSLVLGGCKDDGKTCVNCSNDDLHPPLGAAFSATGGEVTFFDLESHEIVSVEQMQGWTLAAQFAASGSQLFATENHSDGVAVYSMPRFELLKIIDFGANPLDLTANREGTQVFVLSANGSLRRISVADEIVDTTETGQSPRRLRLYPFPESQVWSTSRFDSSVWVTNLQSFSNDTVLHMPANPTGIAFSPLGEKAFIALDGYGIVVLDGQSREFLELLAGGPGPTDLEVSADGNWLAAADSAQGTLKLFDLSSEMNWSYHVGLGAARPRISRDCSQCFVLVSRSHHVICASLSGGIPAITDTITVAATVRELALWETQQ